MEKKTALIINAHPDDSEMAMGGSLFLLKAAGFNVVNACLTRGGAGTRGGKEIREKEYTEAQNKLGSIPLLLDFPDTALENTLESRLAVVKLIREHKPDVVFAPYHRNDLANFDGIMNRDHSVSGQITSEAIKLARFKGVLPDLEPHMVNYLLFYMIPAGVHPTFLFDVSTIIENVKDLISSYKSQIENTNFLEVLIATRMTHGSIIRVKYAEAFVSEMPLVVNAKSLNSLFI